MVVQISFILKYNIEIWYYLSLSYVPEVIYLAFDILNDTYRNFHQNISP